MGAFRIAVDALPAIPGKSGAVGAFRKLLQLGPQLDDSLELIYFVSPAQKAYYSQFVDSRIAERVNFQLFNYPASSRLCRLATQNLLSSRTCRRVGAVAHFSLNPEPVLAMRTTREVFKVADLQFFDVPDQFGIWKTGYRTIMGRRKARRSDLIIANSEYTKQRIVECLLCSEERIEIVHEAVDHSVFYPDDNRSTHAELLKNKFKIEGPFIVYVSAFRRYKNHLTLIRAYELAVRERQLPHRLVLVGNDIKGFRKIVEDEVSKRGLSHCVDFVDYVHHSELASFYHAASLAVYPSQLETFGIPPLEAMACGLPVIVSGQTATAEISGGGAIVVDPAKTEDFAEAMARILTDEEWRAQISRRGLNWCQRYTWERNISETLSLIKDMTA
jgi:glycosyltransferase involved in cell wall biosynthesis